MNEKVQALREQYPQGTRLRLVEMGDEFSNIPPGTRGTVDHVDHIGNINMTWDNGSGLSLIPGIDRFHKVTPQKVLIYSRYSSMEVAVARSADMIEQVEQMNRDWEVLGQQFDLSTEKSPLKRDSCQAILKMAQEKQIDVLAVPNLSMLGRDIADVAEFVKQMTAAGCEVNLLAEKQVFDVESVREIMNLVSAYTSVNASTAQSEFENDSFVSDPEKMHDYHILSKEQFLESYSYLTEAEYDNTSRDLIYPVICEALGWSIHSKGERRGRYYCEVVQHSPAGEDFSFTIEHDGTSQSFVEAVNHFVRNFDADEHIEMWTRARNEGAQGVPKIRTIVRDADDLNEMLGDLSHALRISMDAFGDRRPVIHGTTHDIYDFLDHMDREYDPNEDDQEIRIKVGGLELILPLDEDNLLAVQDMLQLMGDGQTNNGQSM